MTSLEPTPYLSNVNKPDLMAFTKLVRFIDWGIAHIVLNG